MKLKCRQNLINMFIVLYLIMASACVKNRNFDPPKSNCISDLIANSTYDEIKRIYVGETAQIQDDLIIEGYVNSSDETGNFFSILHFQDKPKNPTQGFQIEIDFRNVHLFYPEGRKIYIKLKGLYLGKSKDVFKLGGVFTSFGNTSVGRLPASVVDQHIFASCQPLTTIEPTRIAIEDLEKSLTNTLVEFHTVEIIEEELGQPFAIKGKETERTLIDCNDDEIILLNSGFADFQANLLPEGNGSIRGILLRENNKYSLALRSLQDLDFNQERCEDVVDEFTSNTILISELADPDNNAGARFVELYNSSLEPFGLKGWSLQRYTNGNTEISSSIDLSEFVLEGQSTLVISPNSEEFESVYGFAPDLVVGTNSAANSNGDDNLVLVDPFGAIIDVFGVVGEDGSGTDHEFENGRAVRKIEIMQGNANYTFEEWRIYNDSGGAGTIYQSQEAPEDFTPGDRN